MMKSRKIMTLRIVKIIKNAEGKMLVLTIVTSTSTSTRSCRSRKKPSK